MATKLPSDVWSFAVDKDALREIKAYRNWLAQIQEAKKRLAKTAVGTPERQRCELSVAILEKLGQLQWPNQNPEVDNTRVIRWTDHGSRETHSRLE